MNTTQTLLDFAEYRRMQITRSQHGQRIPLLLIMLLGCTGRDTTTESRISGATPHLVQPAIPAPRDTISSLVEYVEPRGVTPPDGSALAADDAAPPQSAAAAMEGFARAVERRDAGAVLQYFSKKGFRYLETIEKPRQVRRVTYAELAQDLIAGPSGSGWYAALLSDEDESFALATASANGRPWREVSNHKFVLPDDEADSTLYVIWRREGERWFVDTLAVPGA